MAESSCLRRSFSNPSSSSSTAFLEFKEGNPIRALTESVSFGRFVSDSLHWEKWSAFSSNRYLEEAERFSRPGSVAQKRAFFEARYGRKAAAVQPTPRVEEVVAPSGSLAEGKEECEEREEASARSDKIVIEEQGMDTSSIEMDCLAVVRVADESDVSHESKSMARLAEPAEGKDDDLLPRDANLRADSHSEIALDNSTVDRHCVDLHKGKKLKSSATASKPNQSLNHGLTKVAASSKPKIANEAAGNGWKSSLKRIEEKRTDLRSLRMPMNLASSGGFLQEWKTRSSKLPPKQKEFSGPTSAGNKPEVPVCAASKQSVGAWSLDVKRTASILSNSTTMLTRMKTDMKPNSLSTSYSKCPTVSETGTRPATVCAAFRLRSAERAEKRKEFFLKQQERIMAKEAERGQSMLRRQPSRLARSQPPLPKSRNNLSYNKDPDARSRPPWHNSARPAAPKGRQGTMTRSSSLHPRKHVQENVSPNIPV